MESSKQAKRPSAPAVQPVKSGETNWKYWAIGTIVLLLLIFVGQNSQKVKVHFFFASANMPLIFALLIAVVLGVLVGWLVPRLRRSRSGELVSDK
jgi:uncharacterized integral membrane protein